MWATDVSGAAGADAARVPGRVAGQREGALAGAAVLNDGGNAVDAIVAAALVASVVAVSSCGIGGYGGHLVVATPDGQNVACIDFNSAAPAAARPDMYPLDAQGKVVGNVQNVGWRSVGVPGTLAGLQLALERFGTRSFRDMVQPAIRYCRDGFPIGAGLVRAIRNSRKVIELDPGARSVLLPGGEPPNEGDLVRNLPLGDLLTTLAERDSVNSFYRGDIALRLAEAFGKHGGLVTQADLAAYEARVETPLRLEWGSATLHTAPLTAGGASVFQALATLRELGWEKLDPDAPRTHQARLEALRLAWHDRLTLFGDPRHVRVPLGRLLSDDYAREAAARVQAAIRDGKPVAAASDGRPASGTIHLSAVDREGRLASMTLTHGEGFGGRVAAGELGLILGHGLSRFDPHPDSPNAPGPGKRPLNNMCPSVIVRDGRPLAALGAAGGRRIVNSVFETVLQLVARRAPLAAALAAPRVHTEGDRKVVLDARTPQPVEDYLKSIGYATTRGAMANVSAVEGMPAKPC